MKIRKVNENDESESKVQIPDDLAKMFEQYLKDNLSIDIKQSGGDYGSSKYIEVNLYLGKNMISQSSDSLY